MVLRTQETTRSQGTAVTDADEQGIGVGGSPKAAALGYVEGHGSMQMTGTGTNEVVLEDKTYNSSIFLRKLRT